MECGVCMDHFEKLKNSCCELDCNTFTCDECLNILLNFSKKNKLPPRCPALKCKGEYLLSDFEQKDKKIYIELINDYSNTNDINEIIMTEYNKKIMIDQIRKQRSEFMNKNFPKSITYIINITMSDKLKSVKKDNEKSERKKLCYNYLCKGNLVSKDKDTETCNICDSIFCNICEKNYEANHQCKKEILENKELLKTFSQCPKCLANIEKSYGCNSMTCTICQTNFCYRTGEILSVGNNHNQNIKLKDKNFFNNILSDKDIDENIHQLLNKIKDSEPEIISKEFNPIPYIKNKTKKKLSVDYEKYKRSKSNERFYFKKCLEIEKLYLDKKLSLEYLQSIL